MSHDNFSEDCLTLNIMAPSKSSSDSKGYPVLVYIYWGAFQLGESSFYGYKNISDNFVSQEIVSVTFNYRISAFGFFSTGDDVMSGNLGLWDQTLALKFVKEVITNFGGDPSRITVIGASAGAKSVTALMLSPHSNYLFQRAIAISGSVFSPGVISERVVNVSNSLAEALDCKGFSKDIKKCMKEKAVKQILDGIEKIGPSHSHLFSYKYHPRLDGDFFPEDLSSLLKKAPKIELMTGVTELETGVRCITNQMPALTDYGIEKDQWESYSADQLKTFIEEKSLMEGDPKSLKQELIEFYVDRPRKDSKDMDWKDYLERFATLVGDFNYVFPVYEGAMLWTKKNVPVYLFVEEYYHNDLMKNYPLKGAFHANELPYLFNASFGNFFEFNKDDKHFQKNVLDGFISFVKGKKPKVNNVKWEATTQDQPRRYMSFAPKSTMKNDFMGESVNFWVDKLQDKAVREHAEL
ncbi:hypothetical protein L596_016469 [Steinernema carpocapsae]|uniref:Carboxylic ester hydrolase n=1 Tax=Steinernema carpocapsae TaxID=34508 RepID=A0A4U5NJ16_STECR|nr:hypothetical protein L596_016469 [Steinernema carpocapsae]